MAGVRRRGKSRIVAAAMMAAVLLLGACSNSSDTVGDESLDYGEQGGPVTTVAMAAGEQPVNGGEVEDSVLISASPIGTDVPSGLKVIRDGTVDLRVDPGTFEQASAQVRSIAQDLGGYVTAGETYLQEMDGVDYTVGWLTMRIPQDRFDDALNRVGGLGERLSLSVSSQDVTEEYVDLESRLRYWKTQDEFYTRLMAEAKDIEDMVTIQTRMQDVLLNIEQIEGRLRYLDGRTDFSTLTVGLTEVPGTTAAGGSGDAGVIERSIDQAGTVLLATIGGLIVGAAFVLPFALLAAVGFALWLLIRSVLRRKKEKKRPAKSPE